MTFPSNPSVNQIYPALNDPALDGRRFIWTGNVWSVYSSVVSTVTNPAVKTVGQLLTTDSTGQIVYVSDGNGFQKTGANSQALSYKTSSQYLRISDDTEIIPTSQSVFAPGSIFANYNPDDGAFNETVLSETVVSGIYTKKCLIDCPINGYLIRVYIIYRIKNTLRGNANVPSVIFVNGWSADPDQNPTTYYNDNYATICYDWRGTYGGTIDPATNYMTIYPAALSRLNQQINPNSDYATQSSITNISGVRTQDLYYWSMLPRRVLSWTRANPDCDASRIGFYGYSWGGTIAAMMMNEVRLKGIVSVYGTGWIHYWKSLGVWKFKQPYVEPAFSDGNNRFISSLEPQSFAKYATVPFLLQTGTNEFHGQFDRCFDTLAIIPSGVERRAAFEANMSHSDRPTTLANEKKWMDKFVRGDVISWPATGQAVASLVTSGSHTGYPKLTVTPDQPQNVSSVVIWYTMANSFTPPTYTSNTDCAQEPRLWVSATVTNNGNGTWSAETPVNSSSVYLLAYGQVAYTNGCVVATNLSAVIPSSLGSVVTV